MRSTPSEASNLLGATAVAGGPFIHELTDGVTTWLDSIGSAPADKFIRVDYDADGEVSISLGVALTILSQIAPSFVVPGHIGRIEHDFQNSRIFLRLEPWDSGPVLSAKDR
jgi:hypothetical protein